MKKNIYMVQFGTGTNINLLPLGIGQIVSNLKKETELLKNYNLCEIIFRRDDPEILVSQMRNVGIIGFSCFLWNLNISLQTARLVREKFPSALIVMGGPAIVKDINLVEDFLRKHSFIDVICQGEGEEVFVELCNKYLYRENFEDVLGIIYKDKKTQKIHITSQRKEILMDSLSSPYLDGTFDELYNKYKNEFSGISWETNRGCPYECAFCTWGNASYRKIREKSLEQIKNEIEWIGKNKINYIAMSDSNFGIRDRDIDIAMMLSDCKKKYNVPKFISVSWAKDTPEKVLKIADILKSSEIGFRITLSLQSLNQDSVKAVNRHNIQNNHFKEIKTKYYNRKLYTYTELILGLPMETYDSYLYGIEACLSDNIFEQLYVYPLFIFPNTKIGTQEYREKYNIKSKIIENSYTKSKGKLKIKEYVEIVVGNSTMPEEKWIDAFVVGYYTLALHNQRIAFFILTYLKKTYGIKITDLTKYLRAISFRENLSVIKNSFSHLEETALNVQKYGNSHLLTPDGYDDIPFDGPEAIFLELIMNKEKFFTEFLYVVKSYLNSKHIDYDEEKLMDLFTFQEAIIADPYGVKTNTLNLKYNWIDYFSFDFNMIEKPLDIVNKKFSVVDIKPCDGNTQDYLRYHFDIRGVPPFNELYDESGKLVFPPVKVINKVSE